MSAAVNEIVTVRFSRIARDTANVSGNQMINYINLSTLATLIQNFTNEQLMPEYEITVEAYVEP